MPTFLETRPSTDSPAGSPFNRRLRAEWLLLEQLAHLNPHRLTDLQAHDTTFRVTLQATPALALTALAPAGTAVFSSHALRIHFPLYFPAVPLELYLDRPVLHPNVHPETGFICLWDGHRVENSVEHALHKTAAMLGWQLMNLDPRHVMQPADLASTPAGQALLRQLAVPPLIGVQHPGPAFEPNPRPVRSRLS